MSGVTLWFSGWATFYLISDRAGLALGDLALTSVTCVYAVGTLLAFALWLTGVRAWPSIGSAEIIASIKASVLASVSHLLSIYALLLGGGVLAILIKCACEPVVASVVNIMYYGGKGESSFSKAKSMCLLPVVAGLALAMLPGSAASGTSGGEVTPAGVLRWIASAQPHLLMQIQKKEVVNGTAVALLGVVVGALRSNESRKLLHEKVLNASMANGAGSSCGGANQFSVMHCLSFMCCIPAAIWREKKSFPELLDFLVSDQGTVSAAPCGGLVLLVAAGIAFFLYNQAACVLLLSRGPVTQAVLNALKTALFLGATALYASVYGSSSGAATLVPVQIAGLVVAAAGAAGYIWLDNKGIAEVAALQSKKQV